MMASQCGFTCSLRLRKQLCDDCQKVLGNVIGESYSTTFWKTIEGRYDSIKLFDAHHQGKAELLISSRNTGCQMCALLFAQLSHPETSRVETYYIFIKPGSNPRLQLYICVGDVSRFTQSMQIWEKDQAKSLMITGELVNNQKTVFSPSDSTAIDIPLQLSNVKLPRFIGGDLNSDHSFDTIRKWLNDCIENHESCQRNTFFLPKRLVDLIELETTHTVYLRLPSKLDHWAYAAISYTWGPSGYKRLKTKNHDPNRPDLTEYSHCTGIAFNRFPETLQHGMQIAKKLGFRYVWIDSVCIVQDSKVDWAEQSAAMTQIYAGASLNISATSSENSEWGILRPVQNPGIHVGDVYSPTVDHYQHRPGAMQRQKIYIGKHPGPLDLEETVLARRGWVFQERLVSVATVHYTNQGLVWECAHGVKLNHDRQFNNFQWKRQWRSSMYVPLLSWADDRVKDANQGKAAILRQWKEWVAAYAARELFTPSDRLPAIAGVAKTIERNFDLSYAAGIWQQDLVGGLTWKRFYGSQPLKRFSNDTTPSWSWASVQGRLEYVQKELQASLKAPNVEAIGLAHVEEEIPGSSGCVKFGQIRVIGMLQEVTVDKSFHPGSRQREWSEFGIRSGFINAINVQVTLDDPYDHDNLITCWCLRLGSIDEDGREGDLFLLLEKTEDGTNRFKRIGFVETEAWYESSYEIPNSGTLTSASLCELILV